MDALTSRHDRMLNVGGSGDAAPDPAGTQGIDEFGKLPDCLRRIAALQPLWERAVQAAAASNVPMEVRLPDDQGSSSWRLHLIPLAPRPAAETQLRAVLAVLETSTASADEKLACIKARYRLSAAEVEVLALLLSGMPVKRIASLRGAAVSTVRSQVGALFDKTNMRSQRQLLAAFGRG